MRQLKYIQIYNDIYSIYDCQLLFERRTSQQRMKIGLLAATIAVSNHQGKSEVSGLAEDDGKMRLPHTSWTSWIAATCNPCQTGPTYMDHAQFTFSNQRQTGKSIRHAMLPADPLPPLLVFASFTASPRKDRRQRSDEILTRLTLG